MTKYGVSEAKSRVGFKTYAVPTAVAKATRSLRDLLVKGAVFVTAFSMVFSAFVPLATYETASANHDPFDGAIKNKVAICHSGNGKNFVSNEPDISGTGANLSFAGHDGHGFDIIPPFHYEGGVFDGQNWDPETETIWDEDCASDEDEVTVCKPNGELFEKVVFTGKKATKDAEKYIKENPGSTISETGECGTVLPCNTHTEDCDTETRTVEIEKIWEGYETGPSNKSDIKITVGFGDNSTECVYEGDDLTCVDTIQVEMPGGTIDVDETGIPTGWSATSGVGDNLPITCSTQNEEDSCTHTIINTRLNPEPCGTELVVNGDFESPSVTDSANWDVFASGTAGLGWSAEWVRDNDGTPDVANVELHDGVLGDDHTASGTQYTELDSDWQGPSGDGSEDASVKIYQDISTVAGGSYTVKFWTSPRPERPSDDNKIRFETDGVNVVVNEVAGGISWTEHTYTFEALDSVTRISFSDEGPGNSFGGFLDDVSVKQDCSSDITVCKLDTNENYLPGWDVYLKGDKLETVDVDSALISGANTVNNLDNGQTYIVEARGTWQNRGFETVDARFTTPNGWSTVLEAPQGGFPDNLLELQVDGQFVDWSAYSASHEYNVIITGDGSTVNFGVFDGDADTNTQNPSWFGDNSGSLEVDIYPIFKGTTDNNGCVTLNNVPNGYYGLDEIMQDGWTYQSGDRGEVKVGGEDNEFVLVNACTSENCVPRNSDVTICKDDAEGAPLAGWDVFLRSGVLETVNVPAVDADGVTSTMSLQNGKTYMLKASGTADAGDGIEFDADYSYRTPTSTTWTDAVSTYEGFGDTLLDLFLNNNPVSWDDDSVYNTDHTYWYSVAGAGVPVALKVNDVFSENNTNTLSVEIYEVYSGTTAGEDGCVTIQDVPLGTYVLDEVMQDGWENVPEMGTAKGATVEVDGATETFTLVNKLTSEEPCQPAVDDSIFKSLVRAVQYDYSVSGCKYYGDTDTRLAGWQMYVDLDHDGKFDPDEPNDITDSQGYYEIYFNSGDYPLPYHVREVIQDGWQQTYPGGPDYRHNVNLGSESNSATGLDFRNVQLPEPCKEPVTINLVSGLDTDTAGSTNVNPSGNPLIAGSYEGSFGDASNATNIIPPWVNPTTGSFATTGAIWVSTSLDHPGAGAEGSSTEDQWRLFQHQFNVPNASSIEESTLFFTADNAVTVYLNGSLLSQTPVSTYGVNAFPVDANFDDTYSVNFTPVEGPNTLSFVVRNSGGEYGASNPTGLLYATSVTYTPDCDETPPGGGNSGGGSSGSSTNRNPRVLGDSTGLPYQAPQVLGATTELPRTGTPIAILFSLFGILAIIMIPKLAEVKR